jgi:hypothetical protein
LPNEYERAFWEEIWGCVKYIKIPYDTVMNMPVYIRKILIARHNYEQHEMSVGMQNGNKSEGADMGFGLNNYARVTQEKIKNGVNF